MTEPRQRPVRGAATVFSDYASMLGSRVGSVVLSLVSVVITTRILSPAGYGTLAFFNVVALLIFTVASAWTSTAVARYGREELEHGRGMTRVTWARVALTAPLLAVACVVVPLLKLTGLLPPEFSWALVALVVAYGPIWVAQEHVIYLMEAAGRMKLSAIALVSQQAVVVAAVSVLYAADTGQTAFAIAALTAVSAAGVTVVLGALLWRVALWPPSLDRALLRRIAVFSLPMVGFTLSQYVIKSVDLVMVRLYGTAADAGLYAVAYQGYTVLMAVAIVAPQVLTPLFVSLEMAQKGAIIRRYLERVVPQLTFVAAAVAGAAAPLVAVMVPVVFGGAFGDAAEPLQVLLVAVVLMFAAHLLAPIVVLYERTRMIGVIYLVAAAVNVGGDALTLGPLGWGLLGPAIATVVSLGIVLVGYFVVSRDSLGSDARLNPLLLLPLAVGLAASFTLDGALGVVAGASAALLAAAAVQIVLKPFRREDAELFEALDMPAPVRRAALRALAVVAR